MAILLFCPSGEEPPEGRRRQTPSKERRSNPTNLKIQLHNNSSMIGSLLVPIGHLRISLPVGRPSGPSPP